MKRYSSPLILALGLSLAGPAAAQACTVTGFIVDTINMTAAEINPGDVTGVVDATGCNIGIYYDDGFANAGTVGGTVSAASITGSPNYFGIVANGGGGHAALTVNVTNSTVDNVSESPLNGVQHGNAIFYINASTNPAVDDSRTCSNTGSTTGTVSGNTVTGYQKNGITVKCPGVSVTISGNTVTGAGETTAIAQNGIELGLGAIGTVTSNMVSGNEYTGLNDASSTGVLIFGGAGVGGALAINEQVTGNTLTDNDIGIDSVNCNADCSAPPKAPTKTNNIIMSNTLSRADVANISGCGGTQGYQAGIQDLGRSDQISKNTISGNGYKTNGVDCTGIGTTAAVFAIDTTGSKSKVHKNVSP
jgi:hypothetical protein